MLTDFAQWLDAKRPTVVTWNGRGFDMPVITSRALKHGVPMPWWFSDRNTRYRYSTDGHFDLMDFLADFGAAKNARLDAYAKLVGFPGKVGVDGSQVLPMVHAGKIDEVNAYCLCDVAQTAAIFLRVELLRGSYRPPALPRARAGDARVHRRAPTLGEIAGKINRESFTLGARWRSAPSPGAAASAAWDQPPPGAAAASPIPPAASPSPRRTRPANALRHARGRGGRAAARIPRPGGLRPEPHVQGRGSAGVFSPPAGAGKSFRIPDGCPREHPLSGSRRREHPPTPPARSALTGPRSAPRPAAQSGMFVCFFGGLLSRLSFRSSRLRCRRARSVRG